MKHMVDTFVFFFFVFFQIKTKFKKTWNCEYWRPERGSSGSLWHVLYRFKAGGLKNFDIPNKIIALQCFWMRRLLLWWFFSWMELLVATWATTSLRLNTWYARSPLLIYAAFLIWRIPIMSLTCIPALKSWWGSPSLDIKNFLDIRVVKLFIFDECFKRSKTKGFAQLLSKIFFNAFSLVVAIIVVSSDHLLFLDQPESLLMVGLEATFFMFFFTQIKIVISVINICAADCIRFFWSKLYHFFH